MAAIPNEVHFIFGLSPDFGGKPFSLVHYLAVASCHAVCRPDRINLFYTYEPSGPWWERAKPYLTLERVEAPHAIHGQPVQHVAHKADVLRLTILLERGGIYLDMDVLCVRPVTPLLEHDVVLGKEYGMGLCNAVMLARPGAAFVQKWLAEYRTFSNVRWNHHSVLVPAALAEAHPEWVHVLDHTRFFWPMYWREHLLSFFVHPGSSFCDNSFCVHLWEGLTWPYIRRLTAKQLWSIDSEFCRLAREYVDPLADTPDALPASRADGERLDACRTAIAALPPECREAVVLCDLQAMSREEAASMLECSTANVDNRLRRGRELLEPVALTGGAS